ncbi:MAG: molybdopterin biosynthesis protein [Chloroflexota bacterium]|nr:molybdopterin biosynthesis protein [Chloroflexota bacterium]
MRRKVYLEDIPLDEARRRFDDALARAGALEPIGGEHVPVQEALGRVTAAPTWAPLSNPHYHGAAMDGAAVRAEDTLGASEASPVRLKLGAQANWVDTGDPLPADANAVIMIENIQTYGDEIEIMAPVAPWQHVRSMGEDIVATELVLPEGRLLNPVDVGAIAASGCTHVEVRRRPRIAIMPTGTELVEPGTEVKPGDIIDFNSLMLAGQVTEWGGEPHRLPITPDDYELLKERISRALDEHDAVVVNAGSSAGSEDYTARIVGELGELLVHGVAIRPGHPTILGVARGKPILGIPGYPVSAVLTSELFVRPLLYRLLGTTPPERPKLKATITRKILSPMGEDEFLRVKLGNVGGRYMATPLQRGAGVIMSLVRADGIALVPRLSEGLHPGEEVTVELLRRPEEIDRTIVAIGSHDLTLDLLSSELSKAHAGLSLSSSNVGSLGGLIALQRGEAHLAGSHLLDDETGEYNGSYVRRYLPGKAVLLVNLVYRDQGLIVRPGNPKQIHGLDDLLRNDVLYVNRQRGAGTRVLLDYQLKQLGIEPSRIEGYRREEYTHLAVAAAVAGGTADAGLGILAAARALKLDFVPLLKERYDLIIPREYYESDLLRPLLDLIRGAEFRQQVEALGGYDASQMGVVVGEP